MLPVLSVLLIVGSVAVALLCLRKLLETGTGSSLPMLLEISVPLFLLGCAVLPEAFPAIFTRILRHPLDSDHTRILASGVRVTESWIVARWWDPIERVFLMTVISGVVLATWNVYRGNNRKANVAALCIGMAWLLLSALAQLHTLPLW